MCDLYLPKLRSFCRGLTPPNQLFHWQVMVLRLLYSSCPDIPLISPVPTSTTSVSSWNCQQLRQNQLHLHVFFHVLFRKNLLGIQVTNMVSTMRWLHELPWLQFPPLWNRRWNHPCRLHGTQGWVKRWWGSVGFYSGLNYPAIWVFPKIVVPPNHPF